MVHPRPEWKRQSEAANGAAFRRHGVPKPWLLYPRRRHHHRCLSGGRSRCLTRRPLLHWTASHRAKRSIRARILVDLCRCCCRSRHRGEAFNLASGCKSPAFQLRWGFHTRKGCQPGSRYETQQPSQRRRRGAPANQRPAHPQRLA